MPDHLRDDDTTRIIDRAAERAAVAMSRHMTPPQPIQVPPIGLHKCDQGHRIDGLESTQDDHEERLRATEKNLADGRVEFSKVNGQLQSLTDAVSELKGVVKWAAGGIVVAFAAEILTRVFIK